MQKLVNIQTKLKAPKNLYNNFGKYKYRNAEGICEAVKPYLAEEKCVLTLSDDVIIVGSRVYVKATATIYDAETSEVISTVSALARESEEKKGMDDSQITGTASSYARKYALNGLFLLDDTKDADSDEYKVETEEKANIQNIEESTIAKVKVSALLKKCDTEGVDVPKLCQLYKVKSIPELTEKKYSNIVNNWEKVLETCKVES